MNKPQPKQQLNEHLNIQKTKFKNNNGNPRYVFCKFKSHANDTAQTNYQKCCHPNVSNISLRYIKSVNFLLSQMPDWSKNQYSRFYKEFIKVSKSLCNTSQSLLMAEFRNLYTIYAIDLSALAIVSPIYQLTMNVERKVVPAQNVETLQNHREIDAFLVIIS